MEKKLAKEVLKIARIKGAKTISVETLAPYEADENYLKTYKFYQQLGFSPLFNLKPRGYEWNMVYMLKNLCDENLREPAKGVLIRSLMKKDIPVIIEAFNSIVWNKPYSLFEQYLKEAEINERLVWVAYVDSKFAGYITLKWQSDYLSFKEQNIPEIMDLNILPSFRKRGVGTMLLDVAEEEAALRCNIVGLGVGLYGGSDGGYGSAQKLYVRRGYIPDGQGVTYEYRPAIPGEIYPLDNDLILWFTKKLK